MWWGRRSIFLGYNPDSAARNSLEQRVKERLTGAALLVGVVVLLVPELFRGERGSASTVRPTDPAAPPVQSYTIELGAVPSTVTDAESLRAALPQTVAPVVPVPAVAVKPTPVDKPPVAAPDAATPPKPRVAAPKAVARGWSVQVGSFAKRENAARMVQQAAKKSVKLTIAGPDDRGLYRVRSPVQATRAVAAQLQGELQAKGFKGIVASVP
jgi:DedD protein